TREEFAAFAAYCLSDCENESDLVDIFLPQMTEMQLRLIDLKIRCFTEPAFVGDTEMLAQAVRDERTRKQALLDNLGIDKKVLSSNDKFAELLRACGVEAPMKQGKNGPIPAFAKTDAGMQELLEDDDELVSALAEARLEVKSTIIE